MKTLKTFDRDDWAALIIFIMLPVLVIGTSVVATAATFNVEDVTVTSYKVDQYPDLDQAIEAGNQTFLCPYIMGQYEESQSIEIEELATEIQLLNFTTAKMMTYEIRDEMFQRFNWDFDKYFQAVKEDGFLSEEEVRAFLKQNGYRPAILQEELALAAKHPELQLDNYILALGTEWHHEDSGRTSIVAMYSNDVGGHNTAAMHTDSGFMEGTKFAVVKISE
jgi:hypothetical protein